MEGQAEPRSASGNPRLMKAMYMIIIKRVYILFYLVTKIFNLLFNSLKMIFAQIQEVVLAFKTNV